MVWLAGNLKLEVTKCLKELYGPEGAGHLGGGGDDDDNDDDDGEEEVSKATPSYKPRKRRHR